MVNQGLYCSNLPHEQIENHGGGVFKKVVYWKIGIMDDGDFIIYASEKDNNWNYFNKQSSMNLLPIDTKSKSIVLAVSVGDISICKIRISPTSFDKIHVESFDMEEGKSWLNEDFIKVI